MKKSLRIIIVYSIGIIISLSSMMMSCGKRNFLLVPISVSSQIMRQSDGSEVAENDTVNYKNCIVRLTLKGQFVDKIAINNFGNGAYALQIDEPEASYLDKIKDIKITALNNYNDTITAATDITEYCYWKVGDYNLYNNKEELLSQLNASSPDINTETYIYLFIAQMPTGRHLQQFSVMIETEKGGMLKDTTQTFFIEL